MKLTAAIKNTGLLCLLFFLIQTTVVAQSARQIDSLIRQADVETNDTIKIKLYNDIADYYFDNNSGKAITYLEKSLELTKKNNLYLKEANSYYGLGFAYLVKADFKNSLENYLASTKIYERLKDSFRLSNAYMSIGNLYFQNKNVAQTNLYYGKAEQLIIGMKDTVQMASFYNSRGNAYDQLGNYDSAANDLKNAYELAIKVKAEVDANRYLSNLGLTYKHMNKTDEALAVFKKVFDFMQLNHTAEDELAGLYNNMAATNVQAGNYDLAFNYFNKSLEMANGIGATQIVMENYKNMAELFSKKKDFKQQVFYLEKYHQLKDSIYNIENTNQLTELEADYQIEKKNAEIVKTEAQVAKQKSQRNFFIILAVAILLFLAGLAVLYGRIKTSNVLLQQQNEQINKQKNELLTLNHVKDRLFSIISHDLRNPLVTLRSYLMLADNPNLAAEKKQQFKLQTMQAVLHTSDMLDNLLAWAQVQIKQEDAVIAPVEILPLVEDVVAEVQAQARQKQINMEINTAALFAAGNYEILNIALRNLLTNAIKYSNSGGLVKISGEHKEGKIALSVTDNGQGMTKAQIDSIFKKENNTTAGTSNEKGSGLGLFLVMELLEKINAELRIESEPGKGSSFTIQLPGVN